MSRVLISPDLKYTVSLESNILQINEMCCELRRKRVRELDLNLHDF